MPKDRMVHLTAKETLHGMELAHGEGFTFTLRNGQTRTFLLEETSAHVLLTNLKDVKKPQPDGGALLHFSCRVRVDGHPLTLERYLCSQESFYEPYVINGMRIWFDGVAALFDLMTEDHGPCKVNKRKQARFALQDATLPVCPEELNRWCPRDRNFIDIRECYNGDDCWMGPYQGADAHAGLDINHPRGTLLWAPFDLDDQYYFSTVPRSENNRWRGTRRWPDRSLWTIQVAHIVKPLVPEYAPLKAGTPYAEAAGVWIGDHDHSHFFFKVCGEGTEMPLDPWILFWQMFENNKKHAGTLQAAMAPLAPARTGSAVAFRSEGSRAGRGTSERSYFWTFGDGAASNEANPTHVYSKPGLYAVTLTVEDGATRSACTQHMTVDGENRVAPALRLGAPDEIGFRPRPLTALDVYGWPVRQAPHTLSFVARATRPAPNAKRIVLENLGEGPLPLAARPRISYRQGSGWLSVEPREEGRPQAFEVRVDASGLDAGSYQADVAMDCPGASSEPQVFRVHLDVRAQLPSANVVVDDADPGFYPTPYFWVGPRFHKWPKQGHGDFYLTNGGRALEGEFARFTPDLQAGEYEVALSEKTPFPADSRFAVRVRHRHGEEQVWVEPRHSRRIGRFSFDEGEDGFVEILAGGSRGQVLVDALLFNRV